MDGGEGLSLPRWTSKFTLSAQKPHVEQEEHSGGGDAGLLLSPKSRLRGTPGLGQARRVPLGDAANHNVQHVAGGVPGKHPGQPATATPAPGAAAGGEEPGTVTPLACLFERFDALALDGAAGSAAQAGTGGPRAAASGGAQAAGPAPRAPPKSPLGPARRVRGKDVPGAPASEHSLAARTRVSFGTPVVHQYRSVGADAASGGGPAPSDATPLWSNAGHTPYSLSGSRGGSGGGRVRVAAGVSPLGGLDFGEEPGSERDGCALRGLGRVSVELGESESSGGEEDEGPRQDTDSFEFFGGRANAAAAAGGAAGGCGTPVLAAPACGGSGEETPTMFGGCFGTTTPAVALGGAVRAPAESVPFALPTPTPKASLRKPERVPCDLPRPHGAAELRQLLQEQHPLRDPPLEGQPSAADDTMGQQQQPALGSISCLTPVRASRKVQGSLGANMGQVLTPVRRSARKAVPAAAQRGHGGDAALLEATAFCYEGNPVLTPAPVVPTQDCKHKRGS